MEIEKKREIYLKEIQEMAFLPFSYVSALIVGSLGVLNILKPEGPSGLITIAVAALLLLNVLLYKSIKNIWLSSTILITTLGVLLLYFFYSEFAAETAFFWILIYPIIAIMLMGRTIGSLYVLVFTVLILPALVKQKTAIYDVDYSSEYIIYLLLAIYIVTLLIFVYDRIIQHYVTLSLSRNEKLTKTTNSLEQEIKSREKIEAQMRGVLDEIASKNQQLEELTRVDEATISSIGEAVLMFNPEGVITRVNTAAGRILGINQKELINRKLAKQLKFHDLEDKSIEPEDLVISSSLGHRSIVQDTYKVIRPDKTTFYAQMTASPLVVGGTVFGGVAVIRDVTNEVNIDQAKTEFVSIASHQLRTPLSTINWYLEMVLAEDFGKVPPEQREYIQEAYDAGQRMGRLIDALLNVSRIDVGVYAIDPKPVDISKLIDDVLIDVKSKIDEKKTDVKISISDNVGEPNLDVRIMSIIFENLISNAVKYSNEDGKVEVIVNMDKHLTIKVIDNGFGIPKHQQDQIFSKLFRAENAVESEPDGTGLGLYILKAIIEEVGGTIGFVSKEGKGTTFTVHLPKEGMVQRKGSRELMAKAGV